MTRSRSTRAAFRHFETFTTRWRDNDVYGHINNAVFYEYVDTVVNGWLIARGRLVVPEASVVCLVAATRCTFHASLSFPAAIEAGLGVERVGTTSITYRIGLFRPCDAVAAADAQFTHVCVDRQTRAPVPIPSGLRQALDELAV